MDSDEISDFTPNKKKKLHHQYDLSDLDEFGDELDDSDMIGSRPFVPQKRNNSTANSATQPYSNVSRYHTQATQPLGAHVTQPTQPLTQPKSNVQVPGSSPARPPPQPVQRHPALSTLKRPSLVQSALMGPRGTQIRPPPRQKQAPLRLDSSDEEDPVVDHGASEDETQGKSLRPTNLKGKAYPKTSTPPRTYRNELVQETPRVASQLPSSFTDLMGLFGHKESNDSMASSYGNVSRQPRPQQKGPSRAQPLPKSGNGGEEYAHIETLDDIPDHDARKKVSSMQGIVTHVPIWKLYKALRDKRYHEQDALDSFLYDEGQAEAANDQLSSSSPVFKRGQKNLDSQIKTDFTQRPAKPPAKQEVKAEYRTINDKYKQARKDSQPAVSTQAPVEAVKLKQRKLIRGNNQRARSPSVPLDSPVRPVPRRQQQHVVISDDESDGEGAAEESEEEQVPESAFETRLLKFFNECENKELAALCALPEDDIKAVLDQRPFSSLQGIDAVEDYPTTKTGKKRKKPRLIGEKVLGIARQMWEGYDAVDDLVEECERLGAPIREALRGWGVGEGAGELQLMNIDEAHDSGIGTPSSAYNEDKVNKKSPKKTRALKQPSNMGDVVLKDYQIVGLNWLHLLWTKRISCILADDMGLGKTCQVIAFLAQLKLQGEKGPHLIIVTGSTLENWLREFQRFAPELSVRPYYGSQNDRMETADEILQDRSLVDVIVTTYDMATKSADNKFMRRLRPSVCVYDEAHALRNPTSQRYTSLMRIESDFRILLTGTPLQNNLQELVAILAFIMPDIFEGRKEDLDYIFKHRATTKDSDHSALLSSDRIARARTMMTPFILRRKKHQVLDLPTKHRRVEWCEMTQSQSAYYSDLISEAKQFYEDKAAGTKAGSAKASSNIIMALRKAAIHPMLSLRLYTESKIEKIVDELMKHGEFGDSKRSQVKDYVVGDHHQSEGGGDYRLHRYCQSIDYLNRFALKKQPWMDSGKTKKFIELVKAYQANGDRVLVFSQFTTMMDILEAVLETLGIKFMRLDGSTKMDLRQDMIDQFTADESITVFMLSTKAGGAGINLACANKVIIFDSGFNPQDDVQAENRAHRVGQTRAVEVVRILSLETIEVQIHAVGESKMALDERVAGEESNTTDSKEAETKGEKEVEQMLISNLNQEPEKQDKPQLPASTGDLASDFKNGMEQFSVQVKSKQARY